MWSGTPEAFIGKLEEIRRLVGFEVPLAGVEESALLFTAEVMQVTPRRLRGVRGNQTLGVRHVVASVGEGAAAEMLASGPFKLWESDTHAHSIPREGSSDSYAVTPYGVFDHVEHPGTRGHHTFEHVANHFAPVMEQVLYRKVESALTRALG